MRERVTTLIALVIICCLIKCYILLFLWLVNNSVNNTNTKATSTMVSREFGGKSFIIRMQLNKPRFRNIKK